MNTEDKILSSTNDKQEIIDKLLEYIQKLKAKNKSLKEENKKLLNNQGILVCKFTHLYHSFLNDDPLFLTKWSSVEAQEEFITNKLIKKLEELKNEKLELVLKVEQEEEYISNTLQKKLSKVMFYHLYDD